MRLRAKTELALLICLNAAGDRVTPTHVPAAREVVRRFQHEARRPMG